MKRAWGLAVAVGPTQRLPRGQIVGLLVDVEQVGACGCQSVAQMRVEVGVKVAVEGNRCGAELVAGRVGSFQAGFAAAVARVPAASTRSG